MKSLSKHAEGFISELWIEEDWKNRRESEKKSDVEWLDTIRAQNLRTMQINQELCCTRLRLEIDEHLSAVERLCQAFIERGSK